MWSHSVQWYTSLLDCMKVGSVVLWQKLMYCGFGRLVCRAFEFAAGFVLIAGVRSAQKHPYKP